MADVNDAPVTVTVGNAIVDVFQQEKPFLTYNFASDQAGLYKPYFHPVMGPNHWPITQNGEFPGTLRGNFWHRALFIGHQRISHKTDIGSTTTSFWDERADSGRIVHVKFDPAQSGEKGVIVEHLVWRSPEGRDVLREVRTITIPKTKTDERIIDIELRFKPAKEAVRFERSTNNLLALRVANHLCRLEEKQQYTKNYGNLVDFRPLLRGGKIVNSEGMEEGLRPEGQPEQTVRGQRAKWVDFSGPLDNAEFGGIALMDHPMNPKHPTYWNNWNNTLICASFSYDDHYELTVDKELKLKYRVFIHRGDAKEADVEGAWVDFGHRD